MGNILTFKKNSAKISSQMKGELKMKNYFKKLFTFFLLSITCISIVHAESAPSSLTINSYKVSNTPMSFPATFRAKKTNDGRYSYCSYYAKTPPTTSITYSRGAEITDNGINYILSQAYGVKDDSSFFVYQTALWVYMVDKGIMPQPYYDLTVFKSNLNNSNSATANQIKQIVSNAKNAGTNNTSAPTIKIDTGDGSFTLDSNGEYYVSSKITVTSSTNDYAATLQNAPTGSKIEKSGNTMYIKVPASEVSETTKVTFEVSNSKDVYVSYYYNPSNSKYQVMTATYKETKTAKANGSLTIEKEKPGITISKQDITSQEELAGAHLTIKDSEGNEVVSWVSSTKKYLIKGLAAGTYTLTETIAPEGYVLSSETITFKVDEKGNLFDKDGNSISQVVMYNQKENTPGGVSISKQDITNGKELPGATLVVKDYDGNVIDTWVSTDKPHIIENLKAGIYTLTETIAPEGYILSTETITFTVKDDGSITKVVMYNSPNTKDIPVENTASFKTITSSLIGTLIVIVGAVILIKTYKKNKLN